jgi:uncharacterized phage protein (TIGR01671 family)
MRKIKFKQWISLKKRFEYDIGIVRDGHWKGPCSVNFESDPLLQYTGLKDRLGVEIYEGDKCSVTLSTGRKVYAFVSFVDGCFELQFVSLIEINGRYNDRDYLKCYTVNHAIEVIGNIYETSN